LIDYHLHTRLCKHATGEVYEYIESAISKGIKEIAFTDHIPLPGEYDIAHRMEADKMELYIEWIENARVRYPEITILSGIEADYISGFEEYIDQFLNQYNFDLVIMSVHFIKHWTGGNWVFDYSFPKRNPEDVFKDYIGEIIKGIKTNLFDILGHADLIKKDGQSLIKMVPGWVEKLFMEIKKADMSIEINSSGYRRPVFESYPGFDWFDDIKKFEIPLTTGSDAHAPDQVALEFDRVYRELKNAEITSISRYKNRIRSDILLTKLKGIFI